MKVVTPVVNNPGFIKAQFYTLKQHLKTPYEFIVFNDAKQFPDYTNFDDTTLYSQIKNICEQLGIRCIDIPNEHHRELTHAGLRHIQSMNYITQFMFDNPDQYLHIDSDMFLVDTFDIDSLIHYDCAIILQTRPAIEYIWPNLFYFNTTNLKFRGLINWNMTPTTDTGGKMEEWLRSYKESYPDKIFFIRHLASCQWDDTQIPPNIRNPKLKSFLQNDIRNTSNGKFWCELYNKNILHYRAGSNWNGEGKETHQYVTEQLLEALV
jgi:hypothetical protein